MYKKQKPDNFYYCPFCGKFQKAIRLNATERQIYCKKCGHNFVFELGCAG